MILFEMYIFIFLVRLGLLGKYHFFYNTLYLTKLWKEKKSFFGKVMAVKGWRWFRGGGTFIAYFYKGVGKSSWPNQNYDFFFKRRVKEILEILCQGYWLSEWICGIVWMFHDSRFFHSWLGWGLFNTQSFIFFS